MGLWTRTALRMAARNRKHTNPSVPRRYTNPSVRVPQQPLRPRVQGLPHDRHARGAGRAGAPRAPLASQCVPWRWMFCFCGIDVT